MKKLKSLLLEYEDGSTQSFNVINLDTSVRAALVASGLCSPPEPISSCKHYLILEWLDGWKEVVGINSDSASLLRYYVIKRFEDRGRLALDVGETYPLLKIIERKPMEIKGLVIVNETGVKSYEFQSIVESYEGILDDGGKIEYKKFEKDNPFFKNTMGGGKESMVEIKNAVAESAREKGLSGQVLLNMETEKRLQKYQEIAKRLSITGMERQSDVYGLIEILLKEL